MSEADEPPAKAVQDPETYRASLDQWMTAQQPEVEGLRVHDVDMPRATGFSNETVFFSATGNEAGRPATRRYVARIEVNASVDGTGKPLLPQLKRGQLTRVVAVSLDQPGPVNKAPIQRQFRGVIQHDTRDCQHQNEESGQHAQAPMPAPE